MPRLGSVSGSCCNFPPASVSNNPSFQVPPVGPPHSPNPSFQAPTHPFQAANQHHWDFTRPLEIEPFSGFKCEFSLQHIYCRGKKHMWLIFLKFILQRGSGWKLFPVVICTVAHQLNSPAPPPPLDINAQQKFGTKDGGGNKSQMDTVGVRISVWEFCQTPSWNQWKKKRETSLSSEFPFSQKSRTCIFLFSWYSFTSEF